MADDLVNERTYQGTEISHPLIEEKIFSKKTWKLKNIFAGLFVCLFFIIFASSVIFFLRFDMTNNIIFLSSLSLIYAILVFLLMQPHVFRGVERREIQTISRPIVREIPIIKEVPVIRTVEKPVYVSTPKQKLNIPRYDFVGSSQTKTYHTRNCRLGKLIKKKYKESSNDRDFFTKRKYSACKVCILRKVKV